MPNRLRMPRSRGGARADLMLALGFEGSDSGFRFVRGGLEGKIDGLSGKAVDRITGVCRGEESGSQCTVSQFVGLYFDLGLFEQGR